MTEIAFRRAEPPAYALPATLSSTLVILPRRVDEGGTGQYEDRLIDAVKLLRSEGVEASYLHDANERTWIGEKGFTPNEINLIIAVAGAGLWDGVKKLVSLLRGKDDKGEERPIRLKAGRYTSRPNGETTQEWIEIEGSVDDVMKAIDHMRFNEIERRDR